MFLQEFTEWLDGLYWKGYTEAIAIEKPECLAAGYSEFIRLYNVNEIH